MRFFRNGRPRWFATAAVAGAVLAVLSPSSAYANGGNTTSTCTGALCLNLAVTHATNCSSDYPGGWQCTPVAVVTASPFYAGSRTPLVGGYLYFSGDATCQLREKSDGFDNSWSAWRDCSPGYKSNWTTRSWSSTQEPVGGQFSFEFSREVNLDTWLAQDCIEVRMRVHGSGYVQERTDTGTVLSTSTTAHVYYPSSTGWNSESICE
ncbi:MAG TPA: hypothetical protein VGX28_08370 [Frankiaceae bacterium]|jgi:hypothetical protein|nr:hypothetical protein [Frankiaceae bacterium]